MSDADGASDDGPAARGADGERPPGFLGAWAGATASALVAVGLLAALGATVTAALLPREWTAPPWLVRALGWLVVQTVGRVAAAGFWLIERFYAWLFALGDAEPGEVAPGEGYAALLERLRRSEAPPWPPWLDDAWRWLLGALVVGAVLAWLWHVASRRKEAAPTEALPVERRSALTAGRVAADLAAGAAALADALRARLHRRPSQGHGVRRLYRRLLADLAAAGERREPATTPWELAPRAAGLVPERGEDLGALTEAYVRARYGGEEPARATMGALRAAWRRLRGALAPLAAVRGRVDDAQDDGPEGTGAAG